MLVGEQVRRPRQAQAHEEVVDEHLPAAPARGQHRRPRDGTVGGEQGEPDERVHRHRGQQERQPREVRQARPVGRAADQRAEEQHPDSAANHSVISGCSQPSGWVSANTGVR